MGGKAKLLAAAVVALGGLPGTAFAQGGVVGTVYVDSAERDGVYAEADDLALAGYRVELVADAAPATALQSAVSNRDGRFAFTPVEPGRYRLRASSPSGVELAETPAFDVADEQTRELNVRVDPTGRVYDATSGEPVAGVRIVVELEGGGVVPADELGPGQQGQVTAADGIYRLDLLPGRRYRIAVDTSQTSYAAPSTLIPPRDGFAPAGAVVPNPLPSVDGDTRYYLRLDVADEQYAVLNNHIPVDPLTRRVELDKRADRRTASTGDVVAYTVTATNRSARDLSGVYLLDAPERGLTFLAGRVRATVGDASVPVTARAVDPRSRRLIRFGPFELPAGATLTVGYHVAVGTDTRAGAYVNRAKLVDGAGVELSRVAEATLRVGGDPMFDEALVVGRVFCDDDGDGVLDDGETGLMGARVFIDTGSFAVTDSAGLFHLSQIEPGTHLVKLDANSLAGGTPTTEVSRVLYLTRGLPAKVGFGARCSRERVDTRHRRATLRRAEDAKPAAAARVAVAGSVATMTVTVAGEPLALPEATVTPRDDAFELGYRGESRASEWVLGINRHAPDGALVAPMIRTWQGRGAPPARVEWDGNDGAGAPLSPGLYSAQLAVRGETAGTTAISRRAPFAVQPDAAPREPATELWRGDLFAGTARAPQATAELEQRVAALAGRLGEGDTVAIAVHNDGTGTRLSSVAATQRQAELIAQLLADAGVAAERVTARGRGMLDPLQAPTTAAAREQNRRVAVTVAHPAPAESPIEVPAEILDAPAARVGGAAVELDDGGRFETTAAPPVCVELVAADGRLAGACAPGATAGEAPAATSAPPAPADRRVKVSGDLATGTFAVDGAPVAHALLGADARLAASEGGVLDFELSAPDEIPLAEWSLTVRDGAGDAVGDLGGEGAPPPRASFDGGAALEPGQPYRYALTVTATDGSQATSAPRAFVFDPPPAADDIPELARRGTLFRRGGKITARMKNHLSLVASALENSERYVITVRVSARRFASVAQQKLALAARRGSIRDYLTRLGVAPERYELVLEATDARRDEVRVALARPAPEPPAPPDTEPAVAINGAAQPLGGPAIDTEVTVGAREPVVVEIALASGQRARFVAAAPPPPAPAAPPQTVPAADPRAGAAPSLSVIVPREGARLGAPRVPIHGRTAPGNRVTIDGTAIHVRGDGRFDALVTLPPGKQTLTIVAADGDGNEAEIAWPVEIAQTDVFAMALGEGLASSAYDPDRGWNADDAWLDGMTDQTTLKLGPVLLHGRAAAYVKARLSSYRVTAHIDTARDGDAEPLFEQLVDPGRDYAVYGDSAEEVRDAEARGKLYLRVEDGSGNSAMLGNIRGRLRGGDLLRFDRTFYGASVTLDGAELGDDHALDVTAFSAFGETGLSRDINLFRSTGGSLYYLRHGQVVEGSEQIRVVVRDRDSGLIASERVAVRDVDYVIDYPAGRVLFTEPPASVADSGWLLDDLGAGNTPLDGHPVFVEVQYEYEGEGAGGTPTGAYVRDTYDDRLAIGLGVIGEGRGGGDYTLWGADASYRIDDRSQLRAEVGASRDVDGGNFLSSDGGMSFDPVGSATAETSWGWKLGADLGLGDATTARLHAQSLERGFSSGATVLEQGRTKLGGVVAHQLDDTDRIAVRHEADLAELDDRTRLRTAAQWRRALDDWTFIVEGGHDYLHDDVALDANRIGIGGRVARRLDEHVTVRAGQEIQSALSDGDPMLADEFTAGVTTQVGGDLELAPELIVSVDEYLRWNGDNATQLGLKTRVGEGGSMYVREQLGSRDGRFVSTTIVGAADRVGAGGRTYGEYQLENGALGRRNRAVMGLGHRWRVARGLRLGLGFEHQQIFGGFDATGTPIGDNRRDVVHGQIEFVRLDRLKAGGRAELRWDESETVERWQLVAGVGADVTLTRDMTALGRVRVLHTEDLSNQKLTVQPEHLPDTFTAAGHAEVIAGWAYRPLRADWLDLFAQYAYQIEQRPADEAGGSPEARSHVASIAPIVTLPLRLRVSSKLAWKRTRLVTPVLPAGDLTSKTNAALWLLRLAYRVYGKWDLAAEYRQLHLWRTDDATEARRGALFEATYTVARRVRLGLGYNLSRFSDNELGDLERDSHGLFLRVTGHY